MEESGALAYPEGRIEGERTTRRSQPIGLPFALKTNGSEALLGGRRRRRATTGRGGGSGGGGGGGAHRGRVDEICRW